MFKRSFAGGAGLAFAVLLLIATTPTTVRAADIKVLSPVSLRAVLPDHLPHFEKSSGHKVTVGYATLGAITERITNGEPADVSPAQIHDLEKRGKLVVGSGVEIARVGYTAFVKNDAPKPDLGSVDGLKRALLAAKSVALGDPASGGGSGVYLAALMDRLGLSAEIKGKTKLFPSGTEVAEAVAKGDTAIGIGVASDAKIVAGLTSIPLPTEAQSYSVYVAGVTSGSKDGEAAKALIAFLTSHAVTQALTASGFEPR
jgi:molybdate transport system substrate-binding protein